MHPPLQRGFAVHAQAGADDASRSAAFRRHRPIEERQVAARSAFRVGVEQMIRAHIVLIDGASHQSHAERLSIETVIVFDRR